MGKLVCGVGICSKGLYSGYIGNTQTYEYALWKGMLERCYDINRKLIQPSYLACTASENFKNFQYFAEWCNNQIGFGNEGWCLDKDTIRKGNKVYGEDFCAFLPVELNNLLLTRKGSRGEHPIGVCFNKRRGKFIAALRVSGKSVHLGYFSNSQDAFYAYKSAKESRIKELAEKYKDVIDGRVYSSLINWTIEITD